MLLYGAYAVVALVVTAASASASPCIPTGDGTAIGEALSRGGKGAVVTLCPGSVHRLNSTIFFTAPRQTLTTEGDPLGRDRALLIVEGKDQAIAIQADCKKCSNAVIKSLEIDGNRPLMLRAKWGGALVELGNSENQLIRDCKLYEPRGWSAVHFREGDDKQCRGGSILNNEIGPCGEEWDDFYDGIVKKDAPWGTPRADGISLACKDSLVKDNIIYDTSDGAIVIFGSSGSTITQNQIFSRTRLVLGGINLVDYPPWEGDFTGVTVSHNIINANGAFLKIGIVVGPGSWTDDTETIVHGGTITDNEFRGAYFGYGMAVSSAKDFTVLRNKVSDDAAFSGVPGRRCPKAPPNAKPMPFLINRGSAEGVYQDDFVNGEVQFLICLDPAPKNGIPHKPWRMRDDPRAVAAKQAADPQSDAMVNAKIADALVKYQSTLMSNLQALSDRLESVNPLSLSPGPGSSSGAIGGDHLAILTKRMEALEIGERSVRAQVEGVKDDWSSMSDEWKRSTNEQKPILEYIFRSITQLDHGSDTEGSSYVGGISRLTGSSGAIALAGSLLGIYVGFKRWRRRATDKASKGF